jgi:dTMP kinase
LKTPPFFVLDGIDGAGKSTQASLLSEALEKDGRKVVRVRDPGGTALSDRIRSVLLQPETTMAPSAELCLYAAARAQLVREIIRPALESGRVVIADRFTWSTFAYQGRGRGLPLAQIRQLEEIACGGLFPAHVFVLDLPPEKRGDRLRRKGGAPDRLEREGEEFFRRVREGFLELARTHPESGTVVDASQSPEAVHRVLIAKVREILG